MLAQLEGARVVVLNWRDVHHPQAGGAEQYMHQIARRWVAAGAHVTWLTAAGPPAAAREVIDGIERRAGGRRLALYPRTALRAAAPLGRVDYVVDCQNGIPFFSPLFAERDMPVVQVVHHVHQDQFATRFGPVLAAVGRFLEGPATRAGLRPPGRRSGLAVHPPGAAPAGCGFRGPIHIVPNGIDRRPADPRPPRPRPDDHGGDAARPAQAGRPAARTSWRRRAAVPRLRVDIVGDGPERARLSAWPPSWGCDDIVTFHGYQPDDVRDDLLRRAWLTTSTSRREGWGCRSIEAAAQGVPTLALRRRACATRWSTAARAGSSARSRLRRRRRPGAAASSPTSDRARDDTEACQAWARCFTWDRSAELLAGVLLAAGIPRSAPGTARPAAT